MTHYRTTLVEGLKVFYREAGSPDDPTIVLLHGFPSSSHMFRDLIPKLARYFHVVAPDYPGFGNSACPRVSEFPYTFDRLSEVVEQFLVQQGITRFALYMQDYGGPVGMRIAVRHSDWLQALVIQNANSYLEGIEPMFDGLLRPLWERRSPETEAPVLKLFEREGTMFQYHHGARNPAGMNPDAWNMDQWGLDRPGNFAIQLELQANYHTNLVLYPEWQAYLREHQPPTLVVWGRNDPLFGTANVDCLKRDLRDVEAHLLDTGHFALEEECDFIAERIRAFLGARLRPLHPMSF